MNKQRSLTCFALSILVLSSQAFSQGGNTVTADLTTLPVSSNREDVKAIGMGKTQIGNGRGFNAMMYNPALLSVERTSFDLPSVSAVLPSKSIKAISFLADNVNQFKSGQFIKDIRLGVQGFRNAGTDDARLASLQQIQRGLRFLSDLQDATGSTIDNPQVHGLNVTPSLQAQFGNWGVNLYGVGQTGFILFSGSSLTSLAKVTIPNTLNEVSNDLLNILNQLITPLLTPNGQELAGTDVVPVAIAISYIDIVGAVGYGYPVSNDISIGANLKVINRRFSSKAVSPLRYDNILSELRSDFNKSITGVTLDVGGLYQFPKLGTRVGLTLQNIIPISAIRSDLTITGFGQDQNGNPVQFPVVIPFELTLPVLLSAGAAHPLTENWDVALDWVDIANQDKKMTVYGDRLRLGTEYRLDVTKDKLGAAFRGGLAERDVTLGLGLNIFRVLQIDGAYAHDVYTDQNAWFAQLKLGW